MPEYSFTLVEKSEEINANQILAQIELEAETTYKYYAVTVDGEEQLTVANLEEAEELVEELNEEYEEELEKSVALVEVITTDNSIVVSSIETAKADLSSLLEETISNAKEEDNSTETSSSKSSSSSTSSSSTSTKVASLNGVTLSVTPVSGKITSRFGSKESIRSSSHRGIDIAAPKGTDIKAAASGTVIFAGYSGNYGYIVKISHGSGVQTYYAHCSKIYVEEGDKVSAGDVIAAVGSTGNATGNHLHFEVVVNGTSVNPQNYLYN